MWLAIERNRVTSEVLGVIQRTADAQGNVTMLKAAENITEVVLGLMVEAWNECAREAFECGLLHDAYAEEMVGRNPYSPNPHLAALAEEGGDGG